MSSPSGRRGIALAILLAGALVLAALNVWVTVARSAIPLAVNSTVVELAWHRAKVERRFGFDNACLVTFEDGRVMELDPEVYLPLRIGDRIEKRSWDPLLYRNGQPMQLRFSEDALGMIFLMPGIVAGALALTLHHLRTDPR